MSQHAYHKTSDLPQTIPVFPLSGALLFPRWQLPLNIFEPRYLNMIDDAMASHRLIGMVQTAGGSREQPDLMKVGCVGRITAFSETEDGRYLITLSGVSRFAIRDELDAAKPYRQARVDYGSFESDLNPLDDDDADARARLTSALKDYVARNDMKADWSSVDEASLETLVHALSAGCPFSPAEKQALLEAATLGGRCETLIALLEMDRPGGEGGALQ